MMLPYFVEHYGDVASVLGLLITFGGFAVTLVSLRRTKKAAEDARLAAREALSKIGFQLLANEVGMALQLVREIDAACRDRNWASAVHRCDEARMRLAQPQDNPGLVGVERDSIRGGTDEFLVIISQIDKMKVAEDSKALPPKVGKSLHELIVFLGGVNGRLQTQALEV